MARNLENFTDILGDTDEIANSQPLSLPSSGESTNIARFWKDETQANISRPAKRTGQYGDFRSIEEIDPKYRHIFTYPYFNLVQSSVIEDALYSDKSMVVCAPTGSGKTVVFEMAILQLLMELDDCNYTGDFKIIYMAPVKALCTERLSEWYPKFTKLGLMCIEVTGDTNVDFSQLKPYRIIITTPEKWDMLTRRWRDHRSLVEVIKLFLIDEVHILNDDARGPVLEAVVSRMKTIEASQQSAHRIEQLQKQYQEGKDPLDYGTITHENPPRIRFIAVSATVSNPEDVAAWLGSREKPAVYYKFGDECRPVALKRVVEGYPCPEGMSIFKFDIILNYKLWPVIQKYHDGKPTLIFCNTRKSVALTAETLARELTINFTPEQKAKLAAVAATIKNKKLQALVLSGVGCHHAGLLFEERLNIEEAFRNRDLPILITTTTLAMGVNLPAHLVIIKNTQQYVNGAYQEYSISTVLQMVGRAGRPQFDTEATAVIMTRLADKARYQALVGGDEPLQSYLHKRLPENLNSEAALGTVCDVAQCVQWLRSTFLSVRATKDPKRYLGLPMNAPSSLISKKIEELCVKAMNGLASSGLITMDEASCIESTEAGRLMSVFYLDLETMKHIMKIEGNETLEQLLWTVCESHELADMHLRVDERRTLNALNRNNAAATIRFPMKGKINTRQMKLNCLIQAVLGCLPIAEPALNQEALRVMRIAVRVCKCLVAYVTRSDIITTQPPYYSAVLNSIILAKCIEAHLWEHSPYVSKQLKGIGPTFSTLLASAGKVNFTLLEESHPRDLERIMNKSAPAGNILRKQVGLLPKYQLTATPIDEKRVSIKLTLLNQNHLAENRENLTAGVSHKCFLIAGDSENNLLYFTNFKDQDLMSVYDGIITFEITRKHGYEHKIFVQCISSNWVGLDVNCDYVFKNIEPRILRAEVYPTHFDDTDTMTPKRQTKITDTYKERKRKTNEPNFTQSKEKKKRDTALITQFKVLKKSFEVTSKELQEAINEYPNQSDMLKNSEKDKYGNVDIGNSTQSVIMKQHAPTKTSTWDSKNDVDLTGDNNTHTDYQTVNLEDLDEEDNLIVDDRIDSILNEIESEICKNKDVSNFTTKNDHPQPANISNFANTSYAKDARLPKVDMHKFYANQPKKRRNITAKSNYGFLDKVEKSVADEDSKEVDSPQNDAGFTDAIKNQLDRFLQKSTKVANQDEYKLKLFTGSPNRTKVDTPYSCSLYNQGNTPSLVENRTENNYENLTLSQELPRVNVNSKHFIYNKDTKTNPTDIDKIMKDKSAIEFTKDNTEEKCDNDVTTTGFTSLLRDTNAGQLAINTNKKVEHVKDATFNCKDSVNHKEGNENDEDNRLNVKKIVDRYTYYYKENDENDEDIGSEDAKQNNGDKNNKENKISDEYELPNNYLVEKADLHSDKRVAESNKNCEISPANNIFTPLIGRSAVQETAHEHKTNTITENVNLKTTDVDSTNEPNCTKLLPFSKKIKTDLASNICENLRKDEDNQLDIYNKTNIAVRLDNHNLSDSLRIYNELDKDGKTDIAVSRGNHNFGYRKPTADQNNFVYQNRYLFSATNIDVCNKFMPDHRLQIIRKVKLDLDVTEIATKVFTFDTLPEVPHHANESYGESSDTTTEHLPLIFSSRKNSEVTNTLLAENTYSCQKKLDTGTSTTCNQLFKNVQLENNAHENKLNYNNYIPENQRTGYPIEFNETQGPSKLTKNPIAICLQSSPAQINKPYEHTSINETNGIVHKDNTENLETVTNNHNKDCDENKYEIRVGTTKQDGNSNSSQIKDGEINNNMKITHESRNKQTNENKYNNKKQLGTGMKNNIADILQKYRTILGKDNSIVQSNVCSKTATEYEKNNTSVILKRPFKINDLYKVNIPLPKSLIAVEATRSARPASDDIINKFNLEEKTRQVKLNNNQQKAMITTPENPINENFENYMVDNIDIEDDEVECILPDMENTKLENLEEFNLDQSMLDPRKLLQQSFQVQDETIIPPPVEFCESDVGRNEMTQSNSLHHLIPANKGQVEDIPVISSIFDDNSSVLTPSKEIETWTFSHQDIETDCTNSQKHPTINPVKLHTVMRQRSSASNEKYVPFEPRKGTLGQFRFTHKKKMRM